MTPAWPQKQQYGGCNFMPPTMPAWKQPQQQACQWKQPPTCDGYQQQKPNYRVNKPIPQ